MKNSYRKALCALVLSLALTASAFAGEIHTGITNPPQPPPTSGEQTVTTDTVTEIALNLLQSVLSLF